MCLLYTSRAVVPEQGAEDNLETGRAISAALASIVREVVRSAERCRAPGPAWIVAKGGITSHDVAVHGLGIRRAEVAGQLFPGMISVFRPLDAAGEAIGMPYVVFPGNVGEDASRAAEVVQLLTGEAD